MNIIETKLDMTEDEAELKVCERLIVAKQEALMSAPVPDRTYSNAHRRGTPKALFRSMQKDLNRAMTPDEHQKYTQRLWAELEGLKKLAAELAMSVAAYKKATKARN